MNKDIFCLLYIILLSMLLNMCAGEAETKRALLTELPFALKERLTRDISHVVKEEEEIKFLENGDLLVFSPIASLLSEVIDLKVIDQKSLSLEKTFKINTETGNRNDICLMPEKELLGVVVMRDEAKDDGVDFFSTRTGKKVKTLALGWAHKFHGQTLDKEKLVVSTTDAGEIRFIDLESLEFSSVFKCDEAIREVAHNSRKQLLAAGRYGTAIELINYGLNKREKLRMDNTRDGLVEKICISPSGNHVAAHNDSQLFVWNISHDNARIINSTRIIFPLRLNHSGFNRVLNFVDDDKILHGSHAVLSLQEGAIREDARLQGVWHSSNGKGLVVFRKFGSGNKWKLVDIQELLSGEKIETLEEECILENQKGFFGDWMDFLLF